MLVFMGVKPNIDMASIPQLLRTLALNKSMGRWIANPQDVYDKMRDELNKVQVTINDIYWVTDEKMRLDWTCPSIDCCTLTIFKLFDVRLLFQQWLCLLYVYKKFVGWWIYFRFQRNILRVHVSVDESNWEKTLL